MKLAKVSQINIKENMSCSELVKEMSNSGVMGAGKIAKASTILQMMNSDKDCKVFLGVAGALVPGGMKNIIIDMLESAYVDVIVTTGATLTHDLVEALGFNHFQGNSYADDEELNKKGFDRIYDSYMPNKVYETMEDFFKKNYELLSNIESIKDFLWKIGELVPEREGNKSILKTCFNNKIPLFCPAISDSGIGLIVWGNIAKGKKCNVKVFEDMKEILDIAWTTKKAGVIYLGGGVPKNYIQQAMQFSPRGADYGIQITMDRPEPGGSSGAELKEGISWGKMNPKGNFVNVICDITIALPLIWASVKK
ncbi:MAG: deoxyhypusine synthase family protein [Candidatus Woesearchaeota archaeon]